MSHPQPKPGILGIAPYVGGKASVPGVAHVIKLSSNEDALGASPRAAEAYSRAARKLSRYPDPNCTELRQAIGERHGIEPERIVCGNGSDELLGLLCHSYAGPGDEVLYSRHGFLMYGIYAQSAGATPVMAPETDRHADVDALLAAVTPRTKVVFIANPNNPTGTYLSSDEMGRLRRGLRQDVLLVIDAAYAEYVSRNDYSPGLELVDDGSNTVMTRTFSKIHGLSSLRLGWCYCPPVIADVLNRVRAPFNINAAAQAAGKAAIEDVAFTVLSRAHNQVWLPWLSERMVGLGLRITPSVGNFLLVDFPEEERRCAAAADIFLQLRGLICRRVENYGLPNSLRITIGRDDEMHAVVDALADFMG
ncbi:MAG: histidinol-phosphate transaminase [Alphaproteobacteria bacterium]|nr:histidinol-phosphate transaminase [Alphaproteobacteria bacterium]